MEKGEKSKKGDKFSGELTKDQVLEKSQQEKEENRNIDKLS